MRLEPLACAFGSIALLAGCLPGTGVLPNLVTFVEYALTNKEPKYRAGWESKRLGRLAHLVEQIKKTGLVETLEEAVEQDLQQHPRGEDWKSNV